jgi:hypothetical protein
MTDEKKKELLVSKAKDNGDLCNYCPLPEESRGVHCYGGEPVMCEGSHCKEAGENYIEEMEVEE